MRTWAPLWIWQRWLLSQGYRYITSRAHLSKPPALPHTIISCRSESNEPRACWITRISRCRRLHALQVSPTKAIWRVTSAKCLASRPDSFAGRTASGRARSLGDRTPGSALGSWRRGEPRVGPSLRRRLGRRRMRGDEVVHRRLHAALLVRDAGERQRHLRDAQRADEHAVVDVAEMADAEILAGVAADARAVGDVEGVEREVAEGVGVVALRHHHRVDRR